MNKKKISASEKRDRLLGFVTAMPAMVLLFISMGEYYSCVVLSIR